MRSRPFALLSGLLAAAALTAAKPVPTDDARGAAVADGARDSWRAQAVASCIERLHEVPDLSPDDLEAICGCAATRFLDVRGNGTLPPVERGALPPGMNGHVMLCTTQIRPDRTTQVAQLSMRAPPAVAPAITAPPADAKPVDGADVRPPPEPEGGGLWAWLGSLSLPAWLTGASLLWWIAIGIFVFGLLILKVRRRDTRRDLTGPPPSMRRGAPLQPPRRPDLPR